jgi:poly(3-hydroxybutyrate) depolymerase
MLRLLALVSALLLALVSGPAFAQETQDRDALNKRAIDALAAKKYDEGIAILTKVLAQTPKDAATAYNLACAWSRKGDVEKGLEWLGTAVDWGWGRSVGTLVNSPTKVQSQAEMTRADPDFENLRKDPRFEKLLERMDKVGEAHKAALKKAEGYAATPAIYVPEKASALKEMPLLVVLHDAGSTKDEVVKGRWKAIADELGFALVAPSGTIPTGDEPANGMTWFESLDEYRARPFASEKPVNDAVSAFQKEHPLDKARVVIAGDGVGGVVALRIALASSGLYKAALTVNSLFVASLYAERAPSAAKTGLRVALLRDAGVEGARDMVAAQTKGLQTWGLAGEAKTFTPDAKDPGDAHALAEAIRALLSAPAPVPAAAPAEAPKK